MRSGVGNELPELPGLEVPLELEARELNAILAGEDRRDDDEEDVCHGEEHERPFPRQLDRSRRDYEIPGDEAVDDRMHTGPPKQRRDHHRQHV